LAALAALTLLGGCIPPGASLPAAQSPPEGPAQPGSGRLTLDLTKLTDEAPIWERRPVIARAVVEGGRRYHVVAAGETGIAIARAYALPWSRIVDANRLTEPFVLRLGQKLMLPVLDSGPAPNTPEARAAAFRIGIDDLVTGSDPARGAEVAAIPKRPPSAAVRFVWPLIGKIIGRFGPQGSGRLNQGIDIAAASGAGIRSASAGTIAYVGTGVPGYGGLILVRHDGNWISAYGRVASAAVTKGEAVAAGQTLGKSGGEPLHFELRRARLPVDPVNYLPKR
jgi:murein DD-endopeptidase MepM/ murein hydrolase activator NlpD